MYRCVLGCSSLSAFLSLNILSKATAEDDYIIDLVVNPTAWFGLFTQEISAEERKKLQKRKHLADKLKEEVIKKWFLLQLQNSLYISHQAQLTWHCLPQSDNSYHTYFQRNFIITKSSFFRVFVRGKRHILFYVLDVGYQYVAVCTHNRPLEYFKVS